MSICVDSSFLTPVYLIDSHSPEAAARIAAAPPITLTPFNLAELYSSIYRQVFLGHISHSEAHRAQEEFELDLQQGVWDLVDFPENAWGKHLILAEQFAPSLGVRTLDSLHVACALELGAERSWTFDQRQARLAEATGLSTAD